MTGTRYLLTGLLCVALASPAWAGAAIPPRLSKLAATTLGKDFRIHWHMEKNAEICGGEGDAWIGQVEMNAYQRAVGSDGLPTVRDRWVKLDKTYSIFVHELSEPNPQLFDSHNCLE